MAVDFRDNPAEQRFEIYDSEVLAGVADYVIAGDRISLTHTETLPAFAGRGLAKQLITFALEQARAHTLQVIPICPYALRVISENPGAYLDLVPPDARAGFALPSTH